MDRAWVFYLFFLVPQPRGLGSKTEPPYTWERSLLKWEGGPHKRKKAHTSGKEPAQAGRCDIPGVRIPGNQIEQPGRTDAPQYSDKDYASSQPNLAHEDTLHIEQNGHGSYAFYSVNY